MHFRLHLKLKELLFVAIIMVLILLLLLCGDGVGCGLLLFPLRSLLPLRFGVVLQLLESLAVDVDDFDGSVEFAVGIILLKLEKSNRYRIVHLSLSCDCEKFMPAR